MPLTAELPTVKDFMFPMIELCVQKTPNNYCCGRNIPLGTSSPEIGLICTLRDTVISSELRAVVREMLGQIPMNLC